MRLIKLHVNLVGARLRKIMGVILNHIILPTKVNWLMSMRG